MLETLKARILTASKYSRWFWWGVLGLAVLLVAGALLLRRRALLGRLGELRQRLARKSLQLLDAQTAADTARHTDAIDRHARAAQVLRGEIRDIEQQIAAAEEEHKKVLSDIDQASDWTALDALRRKGNER